MRSKLTMALVLAVAIGLLAGTAFADKLICITAPGMGGETTVGQCLAKGEKFAVVDKTGIPRELNDTEVQLLKKTNPKVLDMKAFGIERIKEAPVLQEPYSAP
jgi:hypothetical protein